MTYKNNQWSDLPPELLYEVANHLDAPSDSWHIRSMCSSWRSALPGELSPADDVFTNFLHKRTFFHITLAGAHPSASASGWLFKTEEQNTKPGGRGFHLLCPFSRTKAPVKPFKLDLTKVNIRELGYEYVLQNVPDLHDMEHQKVAFMILSLSPNSNNHGYAILSTHSTGKLLLYRSSTREWSFLDDQAHLLGYNDGGDIFINDWSLHFIDVMEYEGTFYAITNSGRTVAIRVTSSSSVTVTLVTKSIIGGDKRCLVKSGDDLLMVDLYTCPTTEPGSLEVHAVDVFKLDTHQGGWVPVKTLGDRALFLSNHSSFSAFASALPGCRPGSIYFHFTNIDKAHHDAIDDALCVWPSSDQIGVFDFERGSLGSLEEFSQDSRLFSWPPPAWVTSLK